MSDNTELIADARRMDYPLNRRSTVARKKREYRVLLGVTMTREVRVMAHNAKEAATVIYGTLPEEDEMGGLFGTETIGEEFVADVVRVGEEFHADRKPLDSGLDTTERSAD